MDFPAVTHKYQWYTGDGLAVGSESWFLVRYLLF
ncbi:uncharacterized protein METZ01_LOCUS208466 [marine metagenome]|uniref:Uncharacterized protein n=1 Tax=marine metagenome TaxID=408172 RepID=A0A382EYZ1_9ZZZZ